MPPSVLVTCRSAHGTTFALPVLLLSLAALVKDVFGSHFSAWGRSSQGAHLLQAMAATPAQLLDPQGCYRTLNVLAGSPSAVEARQRHDTGPLSAAQQRQRRLGVSSVVAAAVGAEPGSPALRKMMHAAAGKSMASVAAAQPAVVGSSVACSTMMGAAAVHTVAAHRMTKLVKRR